jgi:hypothetical protein
MSFTKLLQPKLNPFGLYIYTHEDTSLNLKQYSNQKIAESKLVNFKGEGTYCNSFTHLFISESNDFWIINNSSFQIRYKKMQIKKKNHSMIFIPPLNSQKENGKIFIVGGDDKKSIYYDLKKNYFLNWAPTNEIHIKPALIQIGEYLYLFDSIFNKKNFCFEKTKLTDVKPRWEKIIPNIDANILNNFPSNTFAVSLDENNNIVFLGGDNINMSNNASYIYNINQNKIYLSQKGTNDCMNFIDKTFYKINGTYVALPEDISESKEIAIIDRNEQSLIKNSVNDNVQSRLCSECKKKEREQSNLNKIISITKNNLKMKYNNINEPKEFGYCMSSCSSEQSKIIAKKNKIKIIEINQKYKKININTNIAANTNTNANANIIINQQQKQEKKIINQENNIINKEEIVQENINIINQAQVGKNQEEIIQNDNIEQNIETNIEQNIEQNQEEIKPVEISQENNENEIAQPEENPEEENNEQIEQIEQIEQKEEINEEQPQPQEMEVKIPEINEVQHEEQDNFNEEIKQVPKQEEINTDINQEENVAQEAKTSVNVENNNIYIKDDVGENNEEHVEEHYEFIDHEEKEEHNEEQELHGEEEQNIEHEENIVHEDIEKEQEQEEINEENNEEHVDENEQELGEEQIEEHVDNEAQEEEGEEQVEEHTEEEIHEEEHMEGQMEENVENDVQKKNKNKKIGAKKMKILLMIKTKKIKKKKQK